MKVHLMRCGNFAAALSWLLVHRSKRLLEDSKTLTSHGIGVVHIKFGVPRHVQPSLEPQLPQSTQRGV